MSETLTAKVQSTLGPVDRLAASVIREGTHYHSPNFRNVILSDNRISTKAYPRGLPPEDNLTGRVFGRFTVLGLRACSSAWVVRCRCGRYTCRRAKSLKDGVVIAHKMCAACEYHEKRKVGGSAKGLKPSSLQIAAIPMYKAIAEILRGGLTSANREAARAALNLAEEGRALAFDEEEISYEA